MTYTYECKACHREWEEEQRIKDPPVEYCPECGGEAHRIIVPRPGTGFSLLGDCWAKDGYA
jgi:putative FmdB family regulatory protein